MEECWKHNMFWNLTVVLHKILLNDNNLVSHVFIEPKFQRSRKKIADKHINKVIVHWYILFLRNQSGKRGN